MMNQAIKRACQRWLVALGAAGVIVLAVIAFPEILFAGAVNRHATAPNTGTTVWRPIPDPTNPGQFLTSWAGPGGQLDAIPAQGSGARTVTWTMSGLTQGYYRVNLKYHKHSGNARDVLVQKRNVAKEASFITWKTRLNQQVGDGAPNVTNTFESTSKNITPFAVSNSASYIWVDALPGTSGGSLQIRLSDSGCQPGGRIVADSVVVDLMGVVK